MVWDPNQPKGPRSPGRKYPTFLASLPFSFNNGRGIKLRKTREAAENNKRMEGEEETEEEADDEGFCVKH